MKANNYYILKCLLKEDKVKIITFLNNLSNDDFCSIMYTNAIFALFDVICELDNEKKIYLIHDSIKKGYNYIPKTLAERCDWCLSKLYAYIDPVLGDYNILPESSEYVLWCDNVCSHTVHVDAYLADSIEKKEGDKQKYIEIRKQLTGCMKNDDLQHSIAEYTPSGCMIDLTDCMHDVEYEHGKCMDLESDSIFLDSFDIKHINPGDKFKNM